MKDHTFTCYCEMLAFFPIKYTPTEEAKYKMPHFCHHFVILGIKKSIFAAVRLQLESLYAWIMLYKWFWSVRKPM